MNSIESDSKEAIDKDLNNVKNEIDNLEDIIKYLIPTDAHCNILYQLGWMKSKQLTTNEFSIFPTTLKDTEACLEMTNRGIKTTKLSKFTCREIVKLESSEYSAIKKDGHWPPVSITPLLDYNF